MRIDDDTIHRLFRLILMRRATPDELSEARNSENLAQYLSDLLLHLEASDERHSVGRDVWHGRRARKMLWSMPGSYNSPIVDVSEVKGAGADDTTFVSVAGIELDLDEQTRVWKDWASAEGGFWERGRDGSRRYNSNNSMFGAVSANLLVMALCGIRPKRYLEIGSGFSSAVALDCNDEVFWQSPIKCTFIDPFPDRLKSILRPSDYAHVRLYERPVQSIDRAIFEELENGDVLFIDSSHVLKKGSDLYVEIFDILPTLTKGVFIHFHDIFYPFDYPEKWLKSENRSWNEAYFLRAFLMHNSAYRIHLWTDYITLFAEELLKSTGYSHMARSRPSSLWLQKN